MLKTAATLALAMLSNVLRNAALFVKEAGIVAAPAWTHGGIGLAAFLTTSLAIAAIVGTEYGTDKTPCSSSSLPSLFSPKRREAAAQARGSSLGA